MRPSLVEQLETRVLFAFAEQDLVSDGTVSAAHTDARLKNPWGLAVGPRGIEVADNGTGVGTMYDGNGNNVVGTVRVPGHAGAQGAPTGVVINGDATKFLINGKSTSAQFIFVTEDGTIDAWSGLKTDKTASVVVDRSADGAVYKGAALGNLRGSPLLFVANFADNRVDTFDATFAGRSVPGRFSDPNLPAGYSPFNVTNINGQLYVTYAKHQPGQDDETAGAGLGVVNVFSTDGKLVRRFATGGKLNAPWGVALAPSNFGTFAGCILVGNFGDGKVTAYTPSRGTRKGQLANFVGQPFALDGLWGIAFGNGRAGNLTAGLYFAAGTNDEANGLYGRLVVDQNYPASRDAFNSTHTINWSSDDNSEDHQSNWDDLL